MINIKGRFDYTKSNERPSENDVHALLRQIKNDAVYGTFAELPEYWNDKFEKPNIDLVKYKLTQESSLIFNFELFITESLFRVKPAGFQHLIGVLGGDLFDVKHSVTVTITDIVLPDSMLTEADLAFRNGRAHTIDDVRHAFNLKDDEPLLAFSFKPRNGLRYEALEDITLKVLEVGFHIVELDTRNLNLQESDIGQLVSLSQKASKVGRKHVTRFSPNLTLPSHLVVDIVKRFVEVQRDPVVIKVDGGLDGISSVQAIRGSLLKRSDGTQSSPVITCYPLFRRQLANRISEDFLIDTLSLSGVDIIYPGSRPSLPSGARELDAANEGNLKTAVMRYHEIVDKNKSMPTVAGGIQAAQLHGFYELLGPKVAYFLGGAVALHKKGPVAGASLCVKVINNAIEIRRNLGSVSRYSDLGGRLIKECENAYETKYPYISPQNLFSKYPGLTGWFTRRK